MAPLVIFVAAGLIGGLIIALTVIRFQKGSDLESGTRLQPPSTNAINMARIRVTGVGGLGMVAMSVAVAVFVPRIRMTMVVGLLLGAALAAVLIARRRRNGPLPSSSQHPGAHSMLTIEAPTGAAARQGGRRPDLAKLKAHLSREPLSTYR